MTRYDFMKKGGVQALRRGALNMYLETCCGTILYDGTGLVGACHSVVTRAHAQEYRDRKRRLRQEWSPTHVTNEAIDSLIATMQDYGAGTFGAILCGCKDESSSESPVGTLNEQEARQVLRERNIVLTHCFAGTPSDSLISLNPYSLEIEFRNQRKKRDFFQVPLYPMRIF